MLKDFIFRENDLKFSCGSVSNISFSEETIRKVSVWMGSNPQLDFPGSYNKIKNECFRVGTIVIRALPFLPYIARKVSFFLYVCRVPHPPPTTPTLPPDPAKESEMNRRELADRFI